MGDYQISTTNVELEKRSLSLVNLTKFAGAGLILKGSCQKHSGNGFTMYFCCCVCFVMFNRQSSHHVCLCYLCACLIGCVNELYVAFTCLYVSHMCLIACTLVMCVHPLCTPWLHMRGCSTCNMVCRHYDNPTNAHIGDPSMARLP